jgi:hypothetical protein
MSQVLISAKIDANSGLSDVKYTTKIPDNFKTDSWITLAVPATTTADPATATANAAAAPAPAPATAAAAADPATASSAAASSAPAAAAADADATADATAATDANKTLYDFLTRFGKNLLPKEISTPKYINRLTEAQRKKILGKIPTDKKYDYQTLLENVTFDDEIFIDFKKFKQTRIGSMVFSGPFAYLVPPITDTTPPPATAAAAAPAPAPAPAPADTTPPPTPITDTTPTKIKIIILKKKEKNFNGSYVLKYKTAESEKNALFYSVPIKVYLDENFKIITKGTVYNHTLKPYTDKQKGGKSKRTIKVNKRSRKSVRRTRRQ